MGFLSDKTSFFLWKNGSIQRSINDHLCIPTIQEELTFNNIQSSCYVITVYTYSFYLKISVMHWICRLLIISRETSLCINLHRRAPLGKGGNLELLTALKGRATNCKASARHSGHTFRSETRDPGPNRHLAAASGAARRAPHFSRTAQALCMETGSGRLERVGWAPVRPLAMRDLEEPGPRPTATSCGCMKPALETGNF